MKAPYIIVTNMARAAQYMVGGSLFLRFRPTSDQAELEDLGVGAHLSQARLHQLLAVSLRCANRSEVVDQISGLRRLVGAHGALREEVHDAAYLVGEAVRHAEREELKLGMHAGGIDKPRRVAGVKDYVYLVIVPHISV